jgi:hypothetical protein
MLRRAAPLLLALPFLWLAGSWLADAFASDETRIRRVVAGMFDGFNDTDLSRVMDGLADGFEDESTGFGRREVRDVLVASFFQDLDADRRYLFRAELVPEELAIELQDADAANVTVVARFYTRARGAEELFWEARIEGRMTDGDDGWQWTRTTRVNHRERRRPR